MKRKLEITTTSIEPSAKRQKTNNHYAIENSPPFLIGDTQVRSLEYNNQKLALAVEIHNDAQVQANYIDAIQARDTQHLLHWLSQNPRRCSLEFIAGLNFTEGVCAVLEHTQPIQSVLNECLEMAIIHQNTLTTNALLQKGARLKNPINPQVKKILYKNKEMKNFILSYGIELMNPKKNFEELVRILLTTTKLQQHVLNEYLNIATQQENVPLMTLLIKAGANIGACIN